MIEMRFKAVLETKGRDTGKTHRVWLLAVKHEESCTSHEEIQTVIG